MELLANKVSLVVPVSRASWENQGLQDHKDRSVTTVKRETRAHRAFLEKMVVVVKMVNPDCKVLKVQEVFQVLRALRESEDRLAIQDQEEVRDQPDQSECLENLGHLALLDCQERMAKLVNQENQELEVNPENKV